MVSITSTGPASAARETTIRWVFVAAFVILAVAIAIPVASVHIPPLADYVNHLARMHAIVALDDDPILARFYVIHWHLLPNLMMDLVIPPLTRLVDLFTAGRIFIIGTLLLQAGGVVALSHALFRRLTPAPLLAFAFLYNYVLLLGLLNYEMGIALALWGAAAWIWLRDGNPLRRGLVSAAFILVLFVCHLFGLGLYGFALLCFECWRLQETRGWRGNRRALMRDLAAFVLPFVLALGLLLVSPTSKLAGWYAFGQAEKLEGLGWMVKTYFDHAEYALGAGLIAVALIAARLGALRMHPVGWWVLGLGLVLYMAMPRVLFGSWGADFRLTIGLLFILLGCFSFEPRRLASVLTCLCAIGALVAGRLVAVEGVWQAENRDLAAFSQSVDLLAPGSRVLVVAADHETGTEALHMGLNHAACLAMIQRSSFVSDAFSRAGMQTLEVRPAFEDFTNERDDDPPTVGQLRAALDDPASAVDFFWSHWWEHYDHVYVLFGDGLPTPPVPKLTPLVTGARFVLFAVTPPVGGLTPP